MHKKNKHTYSHRKKKASLHRTAAFLTAVVMILAALVCGAAIYIHHLSGRPKTVIHALNNENESKGPTQKLKQPSRADRIHSQAGPDISAPQAVTEKPEHEKTAGLQKPEKENTGDGKDQPQGKTVYITFDDGPCSTTPQLLDVLDECDVKATFFVTAQFMNDRELVEQMKEIHRRGHKLAVHSYTHDYNQIYSSVSAFVEDYQKMDNLIAEATGTHSKIFRFPGGSNTGYNSAIRSELLQEVKNRGLIYHDWNAYDGDCDGYTGEKLIERAVTECSYTDRSVLLMHNIPGKETVIESLPEIIRQLREAGYSFDIMSDDMKPIQFV